MYKIITLRQYVAPHPCAGTKMPQYVAYARSDNEARAVMREVVGGIELSREQDGTEPSQVDGTYHGMSPAHAVEVTVYVLRSEETPQARKVTRHDITRPQAGALRC